MSADADRKRKRAERPFVFRRSFLVNTETQLPAWEWVLITGKGSGWLFVLGGAALCLLTGAHVCVGYLLWMLVLSGLLFTATGTMFWLGVSLLDPTEEERRAATPMRYVLPMGLAMLWCAFIWIWDQSGGSELPLWAVLVPVVVFVFVCPWLYFVARPRILVPPPVRPPRLRDVWNEWRRARRGGQADGPPVPPPGRR